MSYNQNNPLSRKSSPLNDGDWIQKATASIKERGTEGVCTGDKFGGPTCPPGSKRYNLAKTFKKMAKKRKGGPSRESSNSPLNQDEKSADEISIEQMGRTVAEQKAKKEADRNAAEAARLGISRRSSSPLNVPDKGGYGAAGGKKSYGGAESDEESLMEAPSRRSSSPLNNTGITGLNYSKELQYMPIEDDMHRGMSRKSSSPLDHASWANEDSKRAKKLYKEGDYAHAHALGIDEHDADYAKHWEHGEHGTSRRSSSPLNDEGHGGAPGHGHATMTKKIGQIEKKPVSPRSKRLRERAMKLSEGVEGQGGYDYENEKVMKLLNRANKIDEKN